MSRSSSWQPRPNASILAAPRGVPCSQRRDNLIASRRELSKVEELEKIVLRRVLPRRPFHQQGVVPGDVMLLEARLRKLTPIVRLLSQLDRLDTVGERQSLAHRRVWAERENPWRWKKAGDHASGRARFSRDKNGRGRDDLQSGFHDGGNGVGSGVRWAVLQARAQLRQTYGLTLRLSVG